MPNIDAGGATPPADTRGYMRFHDNALACASASADAAAQAGDGESEERECLKATHLAYDIATEMARRHRLAKRANADKRWHDFCVAYGQ